MLDEKPRFGHQELAETIILMAVQDYKKALIVIDEFGERLYLKKKQEERLFEARRDVKQIEMFFRGPIFELSSNLDPEDIIRKLRNQVAQEIQERKKTSKRGAVA